MNTLQYEKLHTNLLKLDLIHLETRIDGLLDDNTISGKIIPEIINLFLDEEINFRESRSIKTRIKLAKFPYQKTIDQFDFSFQPELDKNRVLNLFSLKFIRDMENVIFIGPPGVGKTHLGISLGIATCQQGYTSYFITFQDLIDALKKAHSLNRLKRKLQSFAKPKLLIIDEFDYFPLGLEEANLFFQLVSFRYLKGSIILTSNKSYGEWGEIFSQESIAAAILDRLLENSHTIKISGDSYRIKHKKKIGFFDNK